MILRVFKVGGKDVCVNPLQITYISPSGAVDDEKAWSTDDDKTLIQFVGGTEIEVDESFAKVKSRLQNT